MILKLIGFILILPAVCLFIGVMIDDKEFRANVIITLSAIGLVVGLLMMLFG